MSPPDQKTLFGHPTGLFTLFFAEMWERFSYYGMRALLLFYMIKGFLGYGDNDAYKIYGAYTALVYMTPFFGGMLADRLLGPRRAVVLGGFLMAAGHFTMMIEHEGIFFLALAMLIVGNGFFKPNISTMVGSLYPEGSPNRDGGFTLFYMGINLGAAMSPLLCGYVGETYGWHYGFGLATIGMLIGLAVFVVPNVLAQWLILIGAVATAFGMFFISDTTLTLMVNGFVAICLLVSAISAFVALGRGGLPDETGLPPDPAKLQEKTFGVPNEYLVYLGTAAVIPVFAGLVWSNRIFTLIPDSAIESLAHGGPILGLVGTLAGEMSTLPGLLLVSTGALGFGYLGWESFKSEKVERERLWVVLVLMFFSMLFWAFFEQAGTSVNNFTDRNVDRVAEQRMVTSSEVGTVLDLSLTQEQLGHTPGNKQLAKVLDKVIREQNAKKVEEGKNAVAADELDAFIASTHSAGLTISGLDALRDANKTQVKWKVTEANVGMGVAGGEVKASMFQSANPIYILLFGLVFSALWTFLGKRGMEPNTPVKFSLGLLQLGLGFIVLWYGAQNADARGIVGMHYLLLGYLLHTTGELCLSPVGLSMVTKLSPARLVSTAMGAWFLATAFSSFLAAIIATFTGVSHGGGGGGGGIPVPIETVHVYGDVFGIVGGTAIASGIFCLLISPILAKWMHPETLPEDTGGHH